MQLTELRKELDATDEKIVRLFEKRMKTVRRVAEYKRENGLPVRDERREAEILSDRKSLADKEVQTYVEELFTCILGLSRSYQQYLAEREERSVSGENGR